MARDEILGLFEGVGIELEYMVVDGETLNIKPIVDHLLEAQSGKITSEVEFDDITWSNELVLHVIELKGTDPITDLPGAAAGFQRHVRRANNHLEKMGCQMMPSAMHPWMDPHREMRLWPHDYSPVYTAFHRIFDCRGHGWANLQSMHINLPFADDQEFGRLHAAIRLILPILPALAASSPIMDGAATGRSDNRLAVYRTNCARVPSVSGQLIPEQIYTQREYQQELLHSIYQDLKPHDPDGVLQQEWVNARGAIARFDRNTIEIRLIDVQECPQADLAIASLIVETLKLLVAENWSDVRSQQSWQVERLVRILDSTIQDAEQAIIADVDYLRAFGYRGSSPCNAGRLWRHLMDAAGKNQAVDLAFFEPALDTILEKGPLATRIVRAVGPQPSKPRIEDLYRRLCDCLASGALFR